MAKTKRGQKRSAAGTKDVLAPKTPSSRIPAKWGKYYIRLMQLRERLLGQKGLRRSDGSTELPPGQVHLADLATDEFDHDLAWGLLSSEQSALYEVEQALGRIREGSYGVCEATGKPIPKARLNAIPWTRFSVQAERELEARQSVPRTRIAPVRSVSESNKIRNFESESEIEPPKRKRRSVPPPPTSDEDDESEQ